jgi:hypothetical protein
MASTTRMLRTYDHRLRDLVRSAGDIGHATRRGVPRSTARGWLTATRAEVFTLDAVEMDILSLQQEVLALRKRVEWLVALFRLVVVLLKVSRFSLTCARLPDEAAKVSLLRAIDRSRSVLPLRAVLRAAIRGDILHFIARVLATIPGVFLELGLGVSGLASRRSCWCC